MAFVSKIRAAKEKAAPSDSQRGKKKIRREGGVTGIRIGGAEELKLCHGRENPMSCLLSEVEVLRVWGIQQEQESKHRA